MAESSLDQRRKRPGENSEGWQEVGSRGGGRSRHRPGSKEEQEQQQRQQQQQQQPRQKPRQPTPPSQQQQQQRRKQHQQQQQQRQQQQQPRVGPASSDAVQSTDHPPLVNNTRPTPRKNRPRAGRGTAATSSGDRAASRPSDATRRNDPQQVAGRAARRETTLFDHLLARNIGGEPRAGAQQGKQPTGDKSKALPRSATRRHGMSILPPPQQPAASVLYEYRSQAAQPEHATTSGNRAGVLQHTDPRGDSATCTAVASGGNNDAARPKDAAQPSAFSAVRRRIHVANGRAVMQNSDTPKPGKQRLGPRKKKLSTLKKRILLDRLKRWESIQQGKGLSVSSNDLDGRRHNSLSSPGASSPSLLAASNCGTATTDTLCRRDGLDGGNSDRMWVVAIHNLVDEEDVEDADDHAEVERDLYEMASTFGTVCSVEIPRADVTQATGNGQAAAAAMVVYGTAHEAELAREGFHGRVVGGKALEVEVHANAGLLWRVAIDNLIGEEDDLDDDDEYAEIFEDVSAMMGVHGKVVDVSIPRIGRRENEGNGDRDGCRNGDEGFVAAGTSGADSRTVVITFGSLAEAKACVQGTIGRRVGGKALDAKLIAGQPQATHLGLETNGEEEKDTAGIDHGTVERTIVATETAPTPSTKVPLDSPSRGTTTRAGTAGGGSGKWRVVIRNLVDADDLKDDDDYAEVCSDTTALASAYGIVSGLCIPRDREQGGVEAGGADGGARPGEAVAEFQSLEEAEACARGLNGRKVGGQVLEATVVSTPASSRGELEKDKTAAGAKSCAATDGRGEPEKDGRLLKQQQQQQLMRPPPNHLAGFRVRSDIEATPECLQVDKSEGGHEGVVAPSITSTFGHQRPPEAGAAAVVQPVAELKPPVAEIARKRLPMKYKEAAALPKPPGVSRSGPSNAYAIQPPDPEVNDLVFEMLQLLFKFQERVRLSDPAKAKIRQRIVMGLREVLRGVKAKKVQLLILAPNVDSAGGKGGLDDKMVELLDAARDRDTPVVFALSKRKIGRALGKTIKVSAVGVYSFDGAHEQHKQLKRRMEVISSHLSTTSLQEANPLAEVGTSLSTAYAAPGGSEEVTG